MNTNYLHHDGEKLYFMHTFGKTEKYRLWKNICGEPPSAAPGLRPASEKRSGAICWAMPMISASTLRRFRSVCWAAQKLTTPQQGRWNAH